MAAGRIITPAYMPALDADGEPIEGAKLYTYANNTTTPLAVYSDASLTTPLSNPVVADAGGVFVSVFADTAQLYSMTVTDASDAPLASYDSVRASSFASGYPGINVKDFGAVGDGVTDDTAAIQAALDTAAKHISFPDGLYRVVDSHLDGTAVLTSSLADRVIDGPGRITATSYVYKVIDLTGARTRWGVSIAGNSKIHVGVVVKADACVVDGCTFLDFYAPANQYKAIPVQVDFTGLDASVTVTNCTFRNIQAVGNGIGGDGTGLARAIHLSADGNLTKTSLISGNTFDNVSGEEGDLVAFINSNGAGTYYDFPCLVAGNSFSGWTRRGLKVQANKITARNNLFRNTYSVDPGAMQPAISLVQGGDVVIDANTLINCKFAGQIVLTRAGASERVDNVVVTNNVITGVGAETSNTPIFVNSFGDNVVVSGNAVLCPNTAPTNTITVSNALGGYVGGNVVNTGSATPYAFTSSTNLLTNIDTLDQDTAGRRTLSSSGDALGVNVWGASNRALTLYNFDDTLTDAEVISRVQFHQNDNASNAVLASIRAVAVGSAGSTALTFNTGSTVTPDAERVRIGTTGNVEPGADNAQALGSASLRWSTVFSVLFDARSALGEYRVNGTKIAGARKTGWATATGTATRTTFDTTTVTTQQLAERVKALIDDLHGTAGHGLIGT